MAEDALIGVKVFVAGFGLFLLLYIGWQVKKQIKQIIKQIRRR